MAQLRLVGKVTPASFTLRVLQKGVVLREDDERTFLHRDQKRELHEDSAKLTPLGRQIVTELMMSLMVLNLIIDGLTICIELDLSKDSPRKLPPGLQERQGAVSEATLSRLNNPGQTVARLIAGILEESRSPIPIT